MKIQPIGADVKKLIAEIERRRQALPEQAEPEPAPEYRPVKLAAERPAPGRQQQETCRQQQVNQLLLRN